MSKKRIYIERASEGTMTGRIFKVGVAELETRQVALGNRRRHHPGNGCPTDTLESSHDSVEVVTIGATDYILRGPDTFARRNGVAHDASVIIKHDEDVTFVNAVSPRVIQLTK